MNDSVQRFALFGHPVAHTQSPAIHAAFGRQLGIALEYRAVDVEAEGFAAALAAFAAGGGRGANVTLPLKEHAASLCASLDEVAARAGAANTLVRDDEAWRGHNTDGAGLLRDLNDRHREHVRGRRALLLGAGGAARGVAVALADAGVDELVVCNRTPERADALVDAIGEPSRVHARYWDQLGDLGSFDLVVNATAAGRDGSSLSLPSSIIGARCIAYDLNYGEAAVPFLAFARAAGAAHVHDGLGMLVEQAAEAFALWHGQRPETDPVYAELRARAPQLHTAD